MDQEELKIKYNQLQSYVGDNIKYQENVFLINKSTQQRFQYPVVQNNSIIPLELEEALKQNINEIYLKKHQLSEIYKEFNINITNVMTIFKFYFIKPERNCFKNIYTIELIQECIKEQMENQNQCEFENLQKNQKKKEQLLNSTTIKFQAVCLQDGVKLLIPVRFKDCGHLECYDLLSLLMLIRTSNDNLRQFTCRKCSNKYDISSFEQLFKQIYIDKALLKVINQSQPQILQYSYSFKDNSYTSNFKSDDEIINTFHQKFCPNSNLQEFQNQILQKFFICMSDPFHLKGASRKLIQIQYQDFQVNMIDKLTGKLIEYPVRCLKCRPDQCLDIRSFLCHISINDYKIQTSKYQCPICENQIKEKAFFKAFYFDQKLFSQLCQNLSYYRTHQFEYQGKLYMQKEFEYNQVLKSEEFINQVEAQSQSSKFRFNSVRCSLVNQRKLNFPLLLKSCKNQNIIDFESIYEEMQKIDFQLFKDGQNSLKLCQCCPEIKQLQGNVYFHQAFYQILKKYYEENLNYDSFIYDFKTNKITNLLDDKVLNSVEMSNLKLKDGFISMLDDEEYQNLFKPIITQNNLQMQRKEIIQTFPNGLKIIQTQEGIQTNEAEILKKVNEKIKQTEAFEKYGMIIKNISQK